MNLKNIKNNKVVITILTLVLSLIIFAGSYLTSFFYNTYKYNKEQSSTVMNEKNKVDENLLKDETNIVFTRKTPDKNVFIDYKTTIGDYKRQINVEELTLELLEEELSKKGYEKVTFNDKEIIFNKDQESISTLLEPNKYYIGEKDGYIAIFKSDENGIANIENSQDVTGIRIEDLSHRDREVIKNFTKKFDTREDCEEELSAYTS
ncbi:MAG: hypothetical protein ACRC7R_09790 [Sarcina sp.]